MFQRWKIWANVLKAVTALSLSVVFLSFSSCNSADESFVIDPETGKKIEVPRDDGVSVGGGFAAQPPEEDKAEEINDAADNGANAGNNGNAGAANTGDEEVPPPVAPKIVSVSPKNNSASVPPNSLFRISFSQPMDPKAVIDSVTLTKTDTGENVGKVGSNCPDNKTFLFLPIENLERRVGYQIRVSKEAKNLKGTSIDPEFQSQFETRFLGSFGGGSLGCSPNADDD